MRIINTFSLQSPGIPINPKDLDLKDPKILENLKNLKVLNSQSMMDILKVLVMIKVPKMAEIKGLDSMVWCGVV